MTEDTDATKTSFLQKSIFIVSAVCEMLSICMISSNISSYGEDRILVYIGIFGLSLAIMIIWLIAFIGVLYKFHFLIDIVWIMWLLVAFLWLFLISGCPEGLWLIENDDREGVPVTTENDFYYHEYHLQFPDKRPRKIDVERDMKAYDEISYVVDYVPFIKFNGLYTPWSSTKGAVVYLISFSLVFIFFTLTLVTLWKYSRENGSQQIPRNGRQTGCRKCTPSLQNLKTDSDNCVGNLVQLPSDNRTTAHDPCCSPNLADGLSHLSLSQRMYCSRNFHETSQSHRHQVRADDDAQNCNERLGFFARIVRCVRRRSTNR